MWENITRTAISLGLLPTHRDAKYVREVYWQNIRRRTVEKLDDSRATGASGGKEMILDDVDNLVIDIIGKFKCKYIRRFKRHLTFRFDVFRGLNYFTLNQLNRIS